MSFVPAIRASSVAFVITGVGFGCGDPSGSLETGSTGTSASTDAGDSTTAAPGTSTASSMDTGMLTTSSGAGSGTASEGAATTTETDAGTSSDPSTSGDGSDTAASTSGGGSDTAASTSGGGSDAGASSSGAGSDTGTSSSSATDATTTALTSGEDGSSTGTAASSDGGGTTGVGSDGGTTTGGAPQILFEESFVDAVFPPGWARYNVDGRTPNANVAYVDAAWISHNLIDTIVPGQGFAATSTSWYTPAGSADDWMVSPAIGGITADTVLQFNGLAPDASYADGFELWVTDAGNTVDDFLFDGTLLLGVPEEQPTLTLHEIDLGAFAGQTIHLAWRNNSTDDFLLWIDDIVVVDP